MLNEINCPEQEEVSSPIWRFIAAIASRRQVIFWPRRRRQNGFLLITGLLAPILPRIYDPRCSFS